MLKVTSLSGETQKRERLARGFVRNKLSNNQKRSIRRSDAPLLMQMYKRNALEWCV